MLAKAFFRESEETGDEEPQTVGNNPGHRGFKAFKHCDQ